MMEDREKAARDEIEELLARTRKTIAESQALVEQAELRIAETDRHLAEHGLTREQVMKMRFTREQKLAVNEELQRMGLPPIEDDDAAYDFDAATDEFKSDTLQAPLPEASSQDELEARQRKFSTFMQTYRI